MSKPQDTSADPTKVVQKGDVLETKAEFLKAVPMTIIWSQKWTTRTETYYYVVFENTTQGNDRGRLWISESTLAEFEHFPVTKDGNHLCSVSEEFQYGQADKSGKGRFLVWHNKNSTPYQHQFVESLWSKLGQKVGDSVGDNKGGLVKVGTTTVAANIAKAFGDPLRNF